MRGHERDLIHAGSDSNLPGVMQILLLLDAEPLLLAIMTGLPVDSADAWSLAPSAPTQSFLPTPAEDLHAAFRLPVHDGHRQSGRPQRPD